MKYKWAFNASYTDIFSNSIYYLFSSVLNKIFVSLINNLILLLHMQISSNMLCIDSTAI